MLKSLALKTLEDLGQLCSNNCFVLEENAQIPRNSSSTKTVSEEVSRVETENFEHKMGPTNREVGHNRRCRPGLHGRKRTVTASLEHQSNLRMTKKAIQPIGLVHDVQTVCNVLR